MRITWSTKIPKKPGQYLTKNMNDGSVSSFTLTDLDLKVNQEDDHWLSGLYFTKTTIEEHYED